MFESEHIRAAADITRHQAKIRPDSVAQVFNGKPTTYRELDSLSNQVAQGLIAEGCKPDTRIGFIGKNSDLYFELLHGSLKAKSVMVGVNWRLAAPEIAFVLNDAKVEILFVGAEFYDIIEKVLPESPSVRRVVAMDGGHKAWMSFPEWRDQFPAVDPRLPHDPNDDTVQLYTSGTTGHPKGVQLTNESYMLLFGVQTKTWADIQAEEVNLVALPLFHVAGVNFALIGHAMGAKNAIIKEVDPIGIMKLIEKEKINFAFMVPAVIQVLLQHPDLSTTDLSSIRKVLYGASPISEELLKNAQEVFKADFVQLYGMTETNGSLTYLPPDAHDPAKGKLRSCGIPNPGIIIRIADENDNALPAGSVGEIQIEKHPMLLKGYWNRPDATAEAFKGGWFRTGDAGYLDEDGYLYIHDRIKNMIVSGGENIYPAEVENALASHPAVADVAVIGVPDKKWGEATKACVVLKAGASATEEELIAFARTRIAGYKVPKSVDFISELPRNPSGKILHRELRVPYWEGHARMVN